ncbi:MAG: hypothetical protein AAFV53_29690 [Myxococcota bacterium]
MKRPDCIGLWITLMAAGCGGAEYSGPTWWQVETDVTGDDDDDAFDEDEDGGDDDDDDDEALEPGRYFGGETNAEEGFLWFNRVGADGLVCDMDYAVDSLVEVEDCSGCARAFSMVVGAPEVYTDVGAGCGSDAYANLEGQTLRLGGAASGAVYRDDGDGWVVVEDSFAEQDGEWMVMWMNVGESEE